MLHSVIIPCYKSDQTIRKVVELAKNSGQHNAVMAGLNYASGDIIIAMDDDMQTHPSQLPKILDKLDKGYDIVYGYYLHKQHSSFRNFGSYINYMTVRILLKKPKELKTSSFWAIRKFVRDYAVEYRSAYTHLQGVFLRITRNIGSVPVEHFKREVGTSNYTMKKLLQLWANILGFSVVPLQMATILGFIFAVLGILGAIAVIIRKIVRPVTYIGWPSMMVCICFFSGIILMFMGLIGEYVGRIFLGISNNPQYVVRQVDEHGVIPDITDGAGGREKVMTEGADQNTRGADGVCLQEKQDGQAKGDLMK